MNHRCIILVCSAALLFNTFSAPQDTFKIGGGAKFSVVNIRTNETRIVAAVRETNGQYYLPYMSRMPEFNNKLVTGHFSYDSLYSGKWDSVFVTVAIVGNATPQDTFKIGGGAKFSVVNIRTNEARIVAAVRETNGQYYFPSMSRNPEFYNKLVTGYFSYDSLYTGKWDSVFITLTIAGNITAVDRGGVGLKSTFGTSRPFIGRASLYNLRGCRIARPAGVAVRKELTSAKLWLNINHSNPVPGR